MDENEKIKELMSMELLEHILGKERIEVIAEQALKEHLDWYFRGNKQALENILFRISNEAALHYIDETWDTDLRKLCADRIRTTIEEDEHFSYQMFRDEHEGQKILDEEMENARPYIKSRIRKAMDRYVFEMDAQDIKEFLWEALVYKLFDEKVRDEMNRCKGNVYMNAGAET